MKSKLIKAIFLASGVWLAGAILTQDALGADTVVYAIQIGSQTLGTLDLNTGVFTQISTQAIAESQIAVYGGVLYGAGACDCLIQINTSPVTVTAAPTTFNQLNNGFGPDNGFGSTTDGLFVIGAGSGNNSLYSVNTTTGTPTLIGPTGVFAGGGTGSLSTSNDSKKLYWEVQTNCTDALYSINTSTGAATLMGSANGCFPSTTGNPFQMVFTGGTLWANFYADGFGTINTSNGAQTLVSTNAHPAYFGLAPFPVLPATPAFVGSMGHLAAEENWTTTFTLVNKGGAASQTQLNFFGDTSDPSGNGPLTLPLVFPQAPASPLLTASYSHSIAANASLIVATALGPQNSQVLVGSAQLAAAGAVDGFSIFHQIVTGQEAVVPLETRSAPSYVLAYDNTGQVVLGVAVDNLSAQNAVIPVVIRNDAGAVISNPGTTISLAGLGHTSFVLSDHAGGFPVTANLRGTIEFDTPAGGQISVLGLRFTPPNNALTTIPALANVGTGGGSIAHLASGGDGWQTTFALINVGSSSAQATLSFFSDITGAPMPLPLTFPQGNIADTTAPLVTQTLLPGATLLIVSGGAPNLLTGSAQLSTTGNVSGFVIFRHNNQEAVVPLESRNASGYIVAFDNTGETATGIALNTVSAGPVNVPVVVRDDAGNQIATDTIALAANGHTAFTLGTDKYPGTATIRGTIEFDTPANAHIGALGIRIPSGAAHTYTTLPALTK